jgi:hypothetical protein
LKVKLRLGSSLVVLMAVSGAGVDAHHNYGAHYLMNQTVTLDGTLLQIQFQNPHSFVHVETTDDQGERQEWMVEWQAVALLTREGVTKDTLKPGDRVTIVANPSRSPDDHRLWMQMIVRPSDGWKWIP